MEKILERSRRNSVMPIFVGLDLESSEKSLELARKHNTCCFLGVHPLHITSPMEDLREGIRRMDYSDDHVVGVGECGLDFYRSDNRAAQVEIFEEHLNIQGLPFFYHCRNSYEDFTQTMASSKHCGVYVGVVHSFDGTAEQANYFILKGLYIGINGCSLKTNQNLEVVRQIPIERILLETDSPFCLVRKSYACSMYTDVVKARYNEPSHIKQIAQILAELKGMALEDIEAAVYENTLRAFPRLRKYVDFWK
jgi:TatD DNase family protein